MVEAVEATEAVDAKPAKEATKAESAEVEAWQGSLCHHMFPLQVGSDFALQVSKPSAKAQGGLCPSVIPIRSQIPQVVGKPWERCAFDAVHRAVLPFEASDSAGALSDDEDEEERAVPEGVSSPTCCWDVWLENVCLRICQSAAARALQ